MSSPTEPVSSPDPDLAPSSDHVTVVRREGRTIYIVGTAHVSAASVHEVARVIEEVRPDTVCVELCETRLRALTDQKSWQNLDIFEVIRQRKMLFLMATLALSSYQRRLGDRFGVVPGAELLKAVEKAREVGAQLVLADRDIQTTLRRTWANLSFWSKSKAVSAVIGSVFVNEEITEEELEQLKERDHLSDMMKELAAVMPQVKTPLIDERDAYLAASIDAAPGEIIVAVVGAGHVEGLVAALGREDPRARLSELPPPARWTKLLKWIIPTLILAAFYVGYRDKADKSLEELVLAWAIPNAVVAGVFTAAAGAKLLSVLVSMIASPITSLNPTLGAGMVVGLLEAWLRKPTVEDCARINDEVVRAASATELIKAIYRNRFTRVLLVAVMATFGSAFGAWIGAFWVVTLL